MLFCAFYLHPSLNTLETAMYKGFQHREGSAISLPHLSLIPPSGGNSFLNYTPCYANNIRE